MMMMMMMMALGHSLVAVLCAKGQVSAGKVALTDLAQRDDPIRGWGLEEFGMCRVKGFFVS